jgi:opacity protein-like surface antigen
MSLRRNLSILVIALFAIAAMPSTASADWLLTPFIGANFGGAADVDDAIAGQSFENKFEKKLDYGLSLGWMGGGIVGWEIDFGYSPNFFERGTAGNNDFEFTNDSNVTTLTGNVIIGAPIGGSGGSVRPYAVGGVGLIRTNLQDAAGLFDKVSANDFGLDVGGGVMAFFADNVGIRGDLRYFRSFEDSETEPGEGGLEGLGLSDFHFWRGTVGVTFKF